MAVISLSPESGTEVILHVFEDEYHFPGKTATLLFHKMIHGNVSLSDEKSAEKLMHAKDEISDLIY
jgi:hypothetical protein